MSKDKESRICLKCLHLSKVAIGEVPLGAITCLSCKSMDGIICHYQIGKAIFSFAGTSKSDQVIYHITHTTAAWEKGKDPIKAACGSCGKAIPLWMLELNSYVKSAHTA